MDRVRTYRNHAEEKQLQILRLTTSELKKTCEVPFAQDDSCIPKNPQERNLRKASLSVASSLLC